MGLTESEFISLPGTSYDVQGVLDQGELKIVQLAENVADCMLDFEPDVSAYAALEAAAGSTVPALHASAFSASASVHPAALAASPVAPPLPAAASGAAAAASEDPKVLALSQALEALDIGASSSCLKFAKALEEQGIVSIERLKKMPAHQAKKALEIVKMTEFQIDAIMEAIAPPSSAAAAAISPAPSPAPAPAAPSAPSAPALFQEGQRLYGEQRFSEAAERWGRAALQQHGPSHAHLSDMLIDGRPGVSVDLKRGFELAAAGAALGCAHSKGALGRCYAAGYGVAADKVRGLALGRESEAAGSCFGQYAVGACYDFGFGGVAQDYAETARLYRLAAAQGHAVAQFNLGTMFDQGQGVAQDYAEALRLYRLAAEQGHAGAQTNLGFMFEKGRGVAQDSAEAVRHYRLSAAQGNAGGQFNLGTVFENGRGVAPDRAEAIRLYRLAAAQGNADATAALKRLGA
jgi:TPR repeat protein